MRIIPTRIHGMVDYAMGALLIIVPLLFGSPYHAQHWVPIIIGALVILYSLATDYELGVVKAIPMPTHLLMDIAGGVILAISPWLFGFADDIWWPHLVVGLVEIGAGLMTQTRPSYEQPGAGAGGVRG